MKEEFAVYGSEGIYFDPDFDYSNKQLNRTVVSLALHRRRLVEAMF